MSFLYELPKTLIYKMPITTGHNYYFLFKRHNMSHRLYEKKYIYIYMQNNINSKRHYIPMIKVL